MSQGGERDLIIELVVRGGALFWDLSSVMDRSVRIDSVNSCMPPTRRELVDWLGTWVAKTAGTPRERMVVKRARSWVRDVVIWELEMFDLDSFCGTDSVWEGAMVPDGTRLSIELNTQHSVSGARDRSTNAAVQI